MFLGDNIYGDTRDMAVLRAKYAQFAAQPGFARLRATTPVVAIWDDHDFGENDAGGDYPMKDETRRMFLDFWDEPAGSPRRDRDGVYASYVFGPPGRRVQVILPDLRYNRTPLLKLDLGGADYETWARARLAAGLPVPGPYARNPDQKATMLGERQWQWLERQLEVPADVRLIGSSLQVLADFTGWEAWVNFPRDHQRLIDLIRRKNANGVVFLSGDIHYAELSKLDVNVPYTLWDLTSSGLTEEWPVPTPNANRVSEVLPEANFGFIDIDWQGPSTRLTLGIVDASRQDTDVLGYRTGQPGRPSDVAEYQDGNDDRQRRRGPQRHADERQPQQVNERRREQRDEQPITARRVDAQHTAARVAPRGTQLPDRHDDQHCGDEAEEGGRLPGPCHPVHRAGLHRRLHQTRPRAKPLAM